jgi:hypothetical protein
MIPRSKAAADKPPPPPSPPRFHDLPKGTPVQIDLPREMWPEKCRSDGRTVRMQVRGELACAPYCDGHGKWVCRLLGRGPKYPLENMRPQRGHTPRAAPKKQPTITLEALEARAREVFGDELVRVQVRPRVGRSELVTLCYGHVPPELRPLQRGRFKGKDYAHTIAISKDRPGGDPDASRKSMFKFLDDCEATARMTAKQVLDENTARTVIEG